MGEITTVGLDLAKHVFHVVGFDAQGREVKRKKLRRGQVLGFFANLAPCRVGLEACAGAHYWGRQLSAQGHTVRLIPPQHVRPLVRGNKHDVNDARAIAEALDRPGLRFVALKTVAEQDLQAVHRLREGCQGERTALVNRLRGLLGEYGWVMPRGVGALRRRVAELLAEEGALGERLRRLLGEELRRLDELDAHIERYTGEIAAHARETEACRRLQRLRGFGELVASAFVLGIGDPRAYRRGRDVSAAVGLVPGQHSSGGKTRMLGISKRGDRYLRTLLVHGARAVVSRAAGKEDPLSRWINQVWARRGFNKAVVAMANKMARQGWAVLREVYAAQPA